MTSNGVLKGIEGAFWLLSEIFFFLLKLLLLSSLVFQILTSMFDTLMPKFGIEVRFVDGTDPKNFTKAADDKTRCFFVSKKKRHMRYVFNDFVVLYLEIQFDTHTKHFTFYLYFYFLIPLLYIFLVDGKL